MKLQTKLIISIIPSVILWLYAISMRNQSGYGMAILPLIIISGFMFFGVFGLLTLLFDVLFDKKKIKKKVVMGRKTRRKRTREIRK